MKHMDKSDIIFSLQQMIDNCEGAMMAGNSYGLMRNFAFCLQEKLRVLKDDIEYLGEIK